MKPTPLRRVHIAAMVVAALAATNGSSALAQSVSSTTLPQIGAGRLPSGTHLLEQLYQTGIARMGRGDPAGAANAFKLSFEFAPELPQMHYALAIAEMLSDFSKRDRALPLIHEALQAEPSHPLYAIAELLADKRLSVLKSDKALYFTPEGQQRLVAALTALDGTKDAYNGKYLALLFGTTEATGDPKLPQRLANFGDMVGPGSNVLLPRISEKLSLGRLLVLAVPADRLTPYEPRLLQRLAGNLDSLYPPLTTIASQRPAQLSELLEQSSEQSPE
jgi:tetratricopeptide (TPR) repeat protein